ncbi:MAG: sensor histidine kinase [Thermoanaerobaculia bacterium]
MATVHPVFERPARLVSYLAVATLSGVVLALVLDAALPGQRKAAFAFAVPMAIVYAFQCLSAWYPVRQLPPERAGGSRLVLTLAVASLLSATLWSTIGYGWALVLDGTAAFSGMVERFRFVLPTLFLVGVFLYALAMLLHLLFAVVERAQATERRALELQVHAREAELKSLKAQLDPHFLFNSLNSVSALIGSDAPAARRMCYLMAGFFRKSLGLGQKEHVPLTEELYLAETYLAIEEVRFGERLRTDLRVNEETLALAVPPLVLQPLIENAVHHGIAHLLDGGAVTISASRRDGLLELAVENPCDPDRPASRGAGVGLANVRSRLEAVYGHRARMDVDAGVERYRVRLLVPAAPAA